MLKRKLVDFATCSCCLLVVAASLVACGTKATTGADENALDGAAGAASTATCEFDPTYEPLIDPANFVDKNGHSFPIDNPFYPLKPGTVFGYVEGDDNITIQVTDQRKDIMGVSCVVLRDTHRDQNGDVVEDTFDWFAQDVDGNVWYFGEDTKEYENGKVTSTAGSWEGGVSGALPGINMLAQPKIGDVYRQEYFACEAEDKATVIDANVAVSVPFGEFTGCLETYDYSAFNVTAHELKFFCPNVGLVLASTLADAAREELSTVTP